jgi:hypothetical protein
MPEQMDFTQDEQSHERPRRGRKRRAATAGGAGESPTPAGVGEDSATGAPSSPEPMAAPMASAPAVDAEAGDFGDVSHLTKKGLRVVPVVTGAVVDESGNFLFYIDGHEDARSGVQAQVNYLLGSGPAREEHLAPARARVRLLLEKLSRPR